MEHIAWDLAVFPLIEGTKGLARCAWGTEATVDKKDIRRKGWWRPPYSCDGIGIPCKRSRIIVVEIDPRNGGWRTWHSLEGRYRFTTATAHTGRIGDRAISRYAPLGDTGTHWYFEAPDEPLRQGTNALGPGIDVKGAGVNDSHGGIVVAPGSRHPTGGLYHWDEGLGPDDVGFAPFPEFMARPLRPVPRRTPSRRHPATGLPAGKDREGAGSSSRTTSEPVIVSSRREIREEAEARLAALAAMGADSGRNDLLNVDAFWFGQRRSYFPEGEDAVREWLTAACEANGLADDPTSGGLAQVERTIESGLSAGQAHPVTVRSRRQHEQKITEAALEVARHSQPNPPA